MKKVKLILFISMLAILIGTIGINVCCASESKIKSQSTNYKFSTTSKGHIILLR